MTDDDEYKREYKLNEIIDSFDISYPSHDSVNTVSEIKEFLFIQNTFKFIYVITFFKHF